MELPNLPILKKNLPIVIAAISALLAVFLINIYIRQQAEAEKRRILESEKNAAIIIVAAQDIPRGTKISEEMLAEAKLPKSKIEPYASTSVSRIIDKIALVSMAQGEQVTLNKIGVPEKKEVWKGLAARIPPGKRAVTIPVDTITSLSGMVRPGDYVDLVGMVSIPTQNTQGKTTAQLTTLPLFQDILVLAVGQDFSPTPKPASPTDKMGTQETVTMALSPQEANIVSFIQEQGKIRLILRSPTDKEAPRSIPADWDTVLNIVLPRKSTEYDSRPKRSIEIYHGTKKEIKTIE